MRYYARAEASYFITIDYTRHYGGAMRHAGAMRSARMARGGGVRSSAIV